jgi:hypothetical protein
MEKKLIGILAWREGKRFEEPQYLRRLVQAGRKMGAEVFLFSHQDVFTAKKKIRGFIPTSDGGWKGQWFGWPDIVIDRYRKKVKEYLLLRHSKLFFYANSPFNNKWSITQMLMADEKVSQWVPYTVAYSAGNLRQMLSRYPCVYIKPGNGTGGRGIMKVTRRDKGFGLVGRNIKRQKKSLHLQSEAALISWFHKWVKEQRIRKGTFMIQQGLNLELLPNRTVDVRLLIQKDGGGEWGITGLGVRIGALNSAASNLHLNGKAAPFEDFMKKRFGEEKMNEIYQECSKLAHATVEALDKRYERMMEYGLDIGVDTDGRVWLIEVNSKPGREIFREMGQMDKYEEAIQKPIRFAMRLLEQKDAEKEQERTSSESVTL